MQATLASNLGSLSLHLLSAKITAIYPNARRNSVILKAKQNFADVEILFLQKCFCYMYNVVDSCRLLWLKPQPGLYEQVPSAVWGSILGHSCCKLFGTWRWGHRHCLPSDSKALSASDGHGCVCVFLISLSNEEGSFEINFHDNSHSRMAPDFLLSGDRNTGKETVVWDSGSGSTAIYCNQLSHIYDFFCLMAKIWLSLLIPIFHQVALHLEPPSMTCDWYFLLFCTLLDAL